MVKMTKFLQYLESPSKFRGKTFSAKYIEGHISRKKILSAFHYFFHKNILYTSEVMHFK